VNHWLFQFRPETYELVQEHGTLGVLNGHRKRFAEVKPGDAFVAYVSRVQLLDGHGVIDSEAFEAVDPIFGSGSEKYRQRARVTFLDSGLARAGGKLLYGLSEFQGAMKTTPANAIFCKGGFLKITEEDYAWLLGCMEGYIQPEWEHQTG
jgi:hypothetical protein